MRKLLCKDGIVQPGCEEEFKALCIKTGEELRVIQERFITEDPEEYKDILDQLPPIACSWEEDGRKGLIAAAGRLGVGEIWSDK